MPRVLRCGIHLVMRKESLVYAVYWDAGTVCVKSTRHGLTQARRLARGKRVEVLEALPSHAELLCQKLRHVASFIRQDFILKNSRREEDLARRLFLADLAPPKRSSNAGNVVRVKVGAPKTKEQLMEILTGDPLLDGPVTPPKDPWDYPQ